MAATIKYFGRFPSAIVMQTSSTFDGTAQTGIPTITPGLYTFPSQAGGGLYAFHLDPIEIDAIHYQGGGTLTVTKVVGVPGQTAVMSNVVATLSGSNDAFLTSFALTPGEYLTFTSTGGAGQAISVTAHEAEFASDGAI